MRIVGSILFFLISSSLISCSMYYNAYIRNTTNKKATVDVYLLNKADLLKLPNKIKVTIKVIAFTGGYRKHIDSLQNVVWVDTDHFKLELAPNSTADLTDMAGRVLNGSFREKLVVTVSVENRTDTIVNGGWTSYGAMFQYKSMGFGTPVICHDIE